jgi:gamma-glutamyltranspeptidase/glutathione hydrolase
MVGVMPSPSSVPPADISSYGGMVVSADHLATSAGVGVLGLGGNAVDAAIATNAAIAVTEPSLCGMGGDLFALVHEQGTVHALNASGRAGTGADAAALRARGLTTIPLRLDPQAITVPGCVSGWLALHDRFGSLPLATLLAPAIRLAELGFPASPLLVGSLAVVSAEGRANLSELAGQATAVGARVRRPGVARTLRAIATDGAAGFYEGEFGRGLVELGDGLFTADDLAAVAADWVHPLRTEVWGHTLWGLPPNSQSYLLLGAARLAEAVGLPADPDDPAWAHVLVEAAVAAGRDRPARLFEGADGDALVEEVASRVDEIDRDRAGASGAPAGAGDTTYLCTVDEAGMAVSLIQSNASGFGSWIVEPATGINLHNRGLGFSLEEGHPAELAPGRRPPHTLCAAMATSSDDDRLAAVFGTMGGDGQPQILLQLAARLLAGGQSPAEAVPAARWLLQPDAATMTGFDTWTSAAGRLVALEHDAPEAWTAGLAARGHRLRASTGIDGTFGHAHAITIDPDGLRRAAADPRTHVGSAGAH